jgi:hypothetical protein
MVTFTETILRLPIVLSPRVQTPIYKMIVDNFFINFVRVKRVTIFSIKNWNLGAKEIKQLSFVDSFLRNLWNRWKPPYRQFQDIPTSVPVSQISAV